MLVTGRSKVHIRGWPESHGLTREQVLYPSSAQLRVSGFGLDSSAFGMEKVLNVLSVDWSQILYANTADV